MLPSAGAFIADHYKMIKQETDSKVLIPRPIAFPFTRRKKLNTSRPLHHTDSKVIPFLSLPRRKLPRLMKWDLNRKVIPKIKELRPNLVHIHWAYPDALLVDECKKNGWPVVVSVHGGDWYQNVNHKVRGGLMRDALRQTDRVLVVGYRLRSDIIKHIPELEDRIEVLHNPIDTEFFKPEDGKKKSAKTRVLCIANIRPEKGIDVLLDAIEKLPDPEKYEFNLIGHSTPLPYYQQQLQRIKELDPVVKLHSPVPHREVLSWYHQSDFFVLPSRKEGFGIALAEAAACGLPVIGTRSGGPEDIITPENGLLVEPEDPGALSEAISSLRGALHKYDPLLVRHSIVSRFDRQIIRKQLMGIYRSLTL